MYACGSNNFELVSLLLKDSRILLETPITSYQVYLVIILRTILLNYGVIGLCIGQYYSVKRTK